MKFNKIIKYEFKITIIIITIVYVCERHVYVVVHDMICMRSILGWQEHTQNEPLTDDPSHWFKI